MIWARFWLDLAWLRLRLDLAGFPPGFGFGFGLIWIWILLDLDLDLASAGFMSMHNFVTLFVTFALSPFSKPL